MSTTTSRMRPEKHCTYLAWPGGTSAKCTPRTVPAVETEMFICCRSRGWPMVSSNTEALNDSRNTPRSSGLSTGVNSQQPSIAPSGDLHGGEATSRRSVRLWREGHLDGHARRACSLRWLRDRSGGDRQAARDPRVRRDRLLPQPGSDDHHVRGHDAGQRPGAAPPHGRDPLPHHGQHRARHRPGPSRRRPPAQRRQRAAAEAAGPGRHPDRHPPRRAGVQAREVAGHGRSLLPLGRAGVGASGASR